MAVFWVGSIARQPGYVRPVMASLMVMFAVTRLPIEEAGIRTDPERAAAMAASFAPQMGAIPPGLGDSPSCTATTLAIPPAAIAASPIGHGYTVPPGTSTPGVPGGSASPVAVSPAERFWIAPPMPAATAV